MKRITLLTSILLMFMILLGSVAAEMVLVPSNSVPDNGNLDVIYQHTNSNFATQLDSSSVSVCSCAMGSSYLTITNTGNIVSRYSLLANRDYVTFSNNNIIVNPGQVQKVVVYYNSECGKFFNDNVEISVKSIQGDTRILEQSIQFNDCNNLIAQLKVNNNVSMEPCTQFMTSMRITNSGPYNEIFDISSSNDMADYITVSRTSVAIASGKSDDIAVYFAPSCDIYGDVKIELDVIGRKGQKAVTAIQPIKINQNYHFNLSSSDDKIIMCADEIGTFDLSLKNMDNFSNEFIFNPDMPSFANISFPEIDSKIAKSIQLNSYSKTTLNGQLSPLRKDIGNHTLTIGITSLNGNVDQVIDIPVVVENCYEYNMDIVEKKIEKCGKDSFNVNIKIKNVGNKRDDIALSYNGPNFGSLEDEEVSIEGNGEKIVKINFKNIRDEKNTYPIVINMYHKGEVVQTDVFNLDVTSSDECYFIKSIDNDFTMQFDKDAFVVPVKNKGFFYGVYAVRLENAPSYMSLENNKISLGMTEKKDILINIDSEQLDTNAKKYNNGSLIGLTAKPSLIFTHIDSDTSFESTFKLEIVNYPLCERAFSFVYFTANEILCMAFWIIIITLSLLTIFIQFIRRKSIKSTFKSKNKFLIFGLGIWLIITLVIFTTFGVPFMPNSQLDNTNVSTQFQMYEDTTLTINLENFFIDEDQDIVEYGVETIDKEISYRQNGTLITLSPKENWYGNASMYLFATDAFNETAISDAMNIEVIDTVDYASFYDYLIINHFGICLILLLITIISLWLAISYRGKKKSKNNGQMTFTTINIQEKKAKKVEEKKLAKENKTSKKKEDLASKKESKKDTKKVSKNNTGTSKTEVMGAKLKDKKSKNAPKEVESSEPVKKRSMTKLSMKLRQTLKEKSLGEKSKDFESSKQKILNEAIPKKDAKLTKK